MTALTVLKTVKVSYSCIGSEYLAVIRSPNLAIIFQDCLAFFDKKLDMILRLVRNNLHNRCGLGLCYELDLQGRFLVSAKHKSIRQ